MFHSVVYICAHQVMDQKKGKQAEAMPKLTKKQEELLAAQRQRESETRQRLTQVNSSTQKTLQLLLQSGSCLPYRTGLVLTERFVCSYKRVVLPVTHDRTDSGYTRQNW